ncbi:MAG: TonB-dependent receptor [Acidobacteria bacterium]|nr:TonB-dependent receptor [Acidobacteriota bacterium]
MGLITGGSRRFTTIPFYSQLFHRGIANAILGTSAATSLTFSDGPFYPVFVNFSAYAQDTWKVTPRLMLTYGIRWELSPSPEEARGRDPYTVIGFDNPATMTLAPQGTPLYKTTYRNFAPRVGVAYQLSWRKGRETLLRGGFGIFYDLGNGDAGGGFGGYPFSAQTNLTNSTIRVIWLLQGPGGEGQSAGTTI